MSFKTIKLLLFLLNYLTIVIRYTTLVLMHESLSREVEFLELKNISDLENSLE